MFQQHENVIGAKTKKEEKRMPAPKDISYPQYVPERVAEKEKRALGYTEDIVIQRRPSDFGKEAASEKESNIASVAIIRRNSNWGKVELALEEYAALTEENFEIRSEKLDALTSRIDEYINSNETDDAARRKKPAREAYCTTLRAMIEKERREIQRLRDSYGDAPNGEYVNDEGLKIETAKKETGTTGQSGFDADGRINEKTGVMFLRDVKRLDKTGGETSGQWNTGMVARFFDGWSEPSGTVKDSTHEKVTDEEDVSFFSRVGTGFVKKEDVIKVNRTVARFGYKYKREKTDAPLFANAPTAADVKQGALGDCYLLSAMIAVVSQNPEHFLYHMLDCGNTVIVRLYRSDGTPTFVKVDKSVVVKKIWHNRAFADGALWVPIYEKAYAAAGFTGDDTELPLGGKRSYGFINSGQASIALQHITGQEAVEDSFDPKNKLDKEMDRLLIYFTEKYQQQEPFITFAIQQVIGECQDRLEGGFFGTITRDEDLKQYVRLMERHIREKCSNLPAPAAANAAQTQNESQMISDAARKLKKRVQRGIRKYVPGTLGTGKYSREEVRIFNRIKEQLDAGKHVVLSSKEDVSRLLNGQRGAGLAGEGVGGGLVGPHGYAVLDSQFTGELIAPTQMAVKLRNPWGKTGRGYFSGSERREDQRVDITNRVGAAEIYGAQIEDGEFWLDMSDVVRYFRAMSYTT